MNPKEIKNLIREEIRSSVKEVLEQFETRWSEKVELLQNDVKSFKTECKKTLLEDREMIRENQAGIERAEEYSRKENIIIRGIKMENKESNEVLFRKVLDLARLLKVDLQDNHISALHRLPTRSTSSSPPVIVRLVNRWKKEQLINASKNMRIPGIFISHQLTPERFKLFRAAMTLKKEEKIKYVWTVGNRILIRKKDGEEAIQITNTDILTKLGWKEGDQYGYRPVTEEEEEDDAEQDSEESNSTAASEPITRRTQQPTINSMLGPKKKPKPNAPATKTRNTGKRNK